MIGVHSAGIIEALRKMYERFAYRRRVAGDSRELPAAELRSEKAGHTPLCPAFSASQRLCGSFSVLCLLSNSSHGFVDHPHPE